MVSQGFDISSPYYRTNASYNKKVKFIVIGIGINLVKDPTIKNYPTTNILTETGIKVKKLNLIKNIEKSYIKNLKLFA